MPLHVDYRPAELEEVIGNKETIKKLKAIFLRENKDFPHALLFSGPSGCGKTTFARIIKHLVDCEDEDFIEMNASNTRGIDAARAIIDTMNFLPNGESRVYLIDEVHQATKDFQNSILKALEDTPKHVFFILCTTDPQKLLKTIRNRCSCFEVEKLSETQIEDLVKEILDAEGITDFPVSAIAKIAELADGCPRQALVLLDQVIDFDEPEEIEEALKGLSIGENKQVLDLCRALVKQRPWSEVGPIVKGIKEDPEKIRQGVIGYMRNCALNSKSTPDPTFALVFEAFREPNFYNGTAGLVFACLEAIGE